MIPRQVDWDYTPTHGWPPWRGPRLQQPLRYRLALLGTSLEEVRGELMIGHVALETPRYSWSDVE
jgi:hypothetical protein